MPSQTTDDIKLDFLPYDCTPGDAYESFIERLLNFAAGHVDDRANSIADYLLDEDEGGGAVGAVPWPVTVADLRKAQIARMKRAKKAYGLIVRHLTDADHLTTIRQSYFQDGLATYNYLSQHCRTAIDAIRLRDMNKQWNDLDLLTDAGVSENTVLDLAKRIKVLNSKRPNAPINHRKTESQMAERLLELIMDSSKHFQESVTTEYNLSTG